MGYDVIEWSLTMKHGDELVFLGEWLSSVGQPFKTIDG